jgi:lysyl-tRNA synthetase class 2
MKRILAAGLGRIYQICPCFREEESGVHHSREFTMLEWYRVGAGTPELMDEVEDLIAAAARAVHQPTPLFHRRKVDTLIDPNQLPEDWFFQWVDEIEPTLTEPTIVWGYPHWQAALARTVHSVADRFEVYLNGLELANAFAEELSRRMSENDAVRTRNGRTPHPRDPAFLAAVDQMPRCAGIALGIDRLVMALTGASHIEAVQVPSPSTPKSPL